MYLISLVFEDFESMWLFSDITQYSVREYCDPPCALIRFLMWIYNTLVCANI